MSSDIDVVTLRDRIQTALSGEIGEYVMPNSDTVPALRVETGVFDQSAKPNKTTGLEVVIQPYTDTSLQVFLGRQIAIDDVFRIVLKQWDRTQSVATAFHLLVLELEDCLSGVEPLLPRSTALDSLEQQALLIDYRRI